MIIDDFLSTPLTDLERRDLLEVIEDRYQLGATVIASQCPISDWHPSIGDPTLADAICDRLLHNAYKIELRGDSLRRRSTTPPTPSPAPLHDPFNRVADLTEQVADFSGIRSFSARFLESP